MTYNRWRIRNDPNQRKKFIFYSYYVRRKKGPETKLFVITRDKYGIGRERRDVIWSVHRLCIPYRCINFSSFAKGSTFSVFFPSPLLFFPLFVHLFILFFPFFFFCFYFTSPPLFFRHTVKSYSIFDTGENDLHMIQRFFFFSPLWNVPLWNVNRPSGSRARNGIPD